MRKIYFGSFSNKESLYSSYKPGDAQPLITIYRFKLLLCPIWFFGYQILPDSWLFCIIPPLAFEWRPRQ